MAAASVPLVRAQDVQVARADLGHPARPGGDAPPRRPFGRPHRPAVPQGGRGGGRRPQSGEAARPEEAARAVAVVLHLLDRVGGGRHRRRRRPRQVRRLPPPAPQARDPRRPQGVRGQGRAGAQAAAGQQEGERRSRAIPPPTPHRAHGPATPPLSLPQIVRAARHAARARSPTAAAHPAPHPPRRRAARPRRGWCSTTATTRRARRGRSG